MYLKANIKKTVARKLTKRGRQNGNWQRKNNKKQKTTSRDCRFNTIQRHIYYVQHFIYTKIARLIKIISRKRDFLGAFVCLVCIVSTVASTMIQRIFPAQSILLAYMYVDIDIKTRGSLISRMISAQNTRKHSALTSQQTYGKC